MSRVPEDPGKDGSSPFPGGPVSPRVSGQLSDLRPSPHDPNKDILLPSDLPIELWKDENSDHKILAAIASQGVESALQGIESSNASVAEKQRAKDALDEIDRALTDCAADVPERKPMDYRGERRKPAYKGGMVRCASTRPARELMHIPPLMESLKWFKRLRAKLLNSSVDDKPDLRTSWFKIGNQNSMASCVGHAVADLIERQRRSQFDPPSARYIWQASKELDNDERPTTMMAGAGTSIRAALSLVTRFGYALESEISTGDERLYQGDFETFYQRLEARKAASVVNLGHDSKHWMGWLLTGHPIVASLEVGENFLATTRDDARIKADDPNMTFPHAVLLMGYRFVPGQTTGDPSSIRLEVDRKDRSLRSLLNEAKGDADLPIEYLVRNSAGKDWGDQGYAWLPQRVLLAQGREGFGLLWPGDSP